MVIANETRRVDILCYRVSLSQKLLKGSEKYQKLYDIMDEAVKKLQADVGPLTGLPVKMGRGIVNRLSSGSEVKHICASALELLESMLSSATSHPSPNSSNKGNLFSHRWWILSYFILWLTHITSILSLLHSLPLIL